MSGLAGACRMNGDAERARTRPIMVCSTIGFDCDSYIQEHTLEWNVAPATRKPTRADSPKELIRSGSLRPLIVPPSPAFAGSYFLVARCLARMFSVAAEMTYS